jgi:hypothetical protein
VIEIYNILGQKVRRIYAGYKRAGSYTKGDRAITGTEGTTKERGYLLGYTLSI